ncbi:MAG TPA: polysaccharide deacetylase family protein [Candidatus Sumerlaeota bacterium]|mgnify:CR=1 FL=1|nr:polysaccharide deacetylase family protein [Candidatus Sumerlaeota bacterium]
MNAAILTYHHVAPVPGGCPDPHLYVSPGDFSAQMDILCRDGYEVVSLERLRRGLLGLEQPARRWVAITFDDGFEDNHTYAFSKLRDMGYTATFFMVSGMVGRRDEDGRQYLTAEQLREMAGAGMNIGSHTQRHVRLARLAPDEMDREVRESKKELEMISGVGVDWFCYPFGSFSRDIAKRVENAGFHGATSVIRDNRVRAEQMYYLPRVMVMGQTSIRRFRYYFSAWYHYLHHWKNRRRWRDYI